MPLTDQNVECELSYAYLHAIAAKARFGCECAGRHSDNAGVDAYVRVTEKLAPDSKFWDFPMEVQLKATIKNSVASEGRYSYWLADIERYDKLRECNSPMPRLLVVLYLPEDARQWLEHSEEGLISRRCAYWVSLWNAEPSENKSGKTVYLPQRNVLSVDGLREVARRLSRNEELTYAP
jgi:hypothetical protein